MPTTVVSQKHIINISNHFANLLDELRKNFDENNKPTIDINVLYLQYQRSFGAPSIKWLVKNIFEPYVSLGIIEVNEDKVTLLKTK